MKLALLAFFILVQCRAAVPGPNNCGGYHTPGPGLVRGVSTVPSLGTNRVLVILARMTDDPAEPFTIEAINAGLKEANELFQRNSYGKFGLQWTITPIIDLPKSHNDYEQTGFFTLLDDSRAAAKAAGYDYNEYDLDLTRHTPVNGWRTGEANLGSPGARIASDDGWIITHEIGHNLGLFHANFWNTTSPDFATFSSPPFPSNYRDIPHFEDIQFDPDSLNGRETGTGPGTSEEYGDFFDIMGSGQERFNSIYRQLLGWLPDTALAPAASGKHRLYGINQTNLVPGLLYALRIAEGGSANQDLWFQFNPGLNPWIDNGIQMFWAAAGGGGSLLLDASPGTLLHRDDSALEIGKTYSDRIRGIHITPVLAGEDQNGKWIDVVANYGAFSTNRAPTLTLRAAELSLHNNEPIDIVAEATDPDGDPLAYHWYLADGTTSSNTNHLTGISWRDAGDHVILCEVSDLRGGKTSRQVVVRVGSPHTYRISGFVFDETGAPLPDVRVHNGNAGRGYLGTFTDSTGAYTLTGAVPGTYTNGAFLYGYRTSAANFEWPLTISNTDVTSINFVARTIPQVSVSLSTNIVSESADSSVMIEFSRTGPTDDPLTITFGLSGTAQPNRDYSGFLIPTATFPVGVSKIQLPLQIFNDSSSEPTETVTIEVIQPGSQKRNRGRSDEYTVYYPGWELGSVLGTELWFQTDPSYIPFQSTSTLTILDDDSAPDQVITVLASGQPAIEQPRFESFFTLKRTGNTDAPLTVAYSLSGSAIENVDFEPIPNNSPRGQVERTILIEPGINQLKIPIVPIDDGIPEGFETVTFQLLESDAYKIGNDSATVQIKDSVAYPIAIAIQYSKTGDFLITVFGELGKSHVLEESLGLGNWKPIKSAVLFDTPWVVPVPKNKNGDAWFYRVVQK